MATESCHLISVYSGCSNSSLVAPPVDNRLGVCGAQVAAKRTVPAARPQHSRTLSHPTSVTFHRRVGMTDPMYAG